MDSKYKTFLPLSNLILNIFLIFGGFSIILYFVGFMEITSYYATLGISSRFLDFQNYEYINNGLILYIPIIFLLTVYIPILFPLWIILGDIKNIKSEISNGEIKIPKRKLLINKVLNLENKLWLKYKILNKFFGFVFIIILILVTIFYFLGQINNVCFSAIFGLKVFIVFTLIYSLNNSMKVENLKNAQLIKNILLILLIFFFALAFLPILEGYLDAKRQLMTNDFKSYSVSIREGKVVNDAKFVYFGKNNYFFFIDKRLTVIPQAEIILLEKN